MKRAKVFSRRAIRVPSVIEPDRTDRQFVTQAAAERIMHVVHTGFLGSGKQVAGVKKECALKLAVNRKRVLDIENRVEFAADRISFGIMRAEVALTETAHSGSATVKNRSSIGRVVGSSGPEWLSECTIPARAPKASDDC